MSFGRTAAPTAKGDGVKGGVALGVREGVGVNSGVMLGLGLGVGVAMSGAAVGKTNGAKARGVGRQAISDRRQTLERISRKP